MQKYTLYNTPIISPILRRVFMFAFKAVGWKAEGTPPEDGRCVLAAAPHTSNWDLVAVLCVAFELRIHTYWMGKESIFRWPFKSLMLWLGGVPIDRSKSTNSVAQSIEAFETHGRMALVIPPEGTRSRTNKWKTGFYHIAEGAKVPLILGYVDYGRRTSGMGPVFELTGEVEKDMAEIKAYYSTITPKYPENFDCPGP